MSGNDDLGYIMLHQAIRMGEQLGLIGKYAPLSPEQSTTSSSGELDSSARRTAWGLFHVDTYVLCSIIVVLYLMVEQGGPHQLPKTISYRPSQCRPNGKKPIHGKSSLGAVPNTPRGKTIVPESIFR